MTYPALSAERVDSSELDTGLTDDHMRLLEWLSEHPRASLTAAAQALGPAVAKVEALCSDLVAVGRVMRVMTLGNAWLLLAS